MKRLLALLLGGLGLRALLRRLRPQAAFEPPVSDLKARLAESRATTAGAPAATSEELRATVEAELAEADSGETPVDEVVDVDARRADVHARARHAIDELREP